MKPGTHKQRDVMCPIELWDFWEQFWPVLFDLWWMGAEEATEEVSVSDWSERQ